MSASPAAVPIPSFRPSVDIVGRLTAGLSPEAAAAQASAAYGRWMESSSPIAFVRVGSVPGADFCESRARVRRSRGVSCVAGPAGWNMRVSLGDNDRQRLRIADGEADRTVPRNRPSAGAGRDVIASVRSASHRGHRARVGRTAPGIPGHRRAVLRDPQMDPVLGGHRPPCESARVCRDGAHGGTRRVRRHLRSVGLDRSPQPDEPSGTRPCAARRRPAIQTV